MANFYESNFKLDMHGTSAADAFNAGLGNDTIWGGFGSDVVNGGSGDDTIHATTYAAQPFVGPWGNDVVYGGVGNDFIDYANTTSNVVLYGDNAQWSRQDGNDTIVSGSGNDWIYGGGGNDVISGGAGNDVIYGDMPISRTGGNDVIFGGDGRDTIYGGAGNDTIWGNSGVDFMYGGSGADTFKFNAGDTGLHYADADVIYDFHPSSDRGFPTGDTIDFTTMEKGTSSNFDHKAIINIHGSDAAEYANALGTANAEETVNPNLKYVFVTDGQNGWLFADTNGDHHLDAGIELRGVTDMHYWNVV